jgi:hypothetical protein
MASMVGGFTPPPYDQASARPHTLSIPLYLVLTVLTLGIFNLYWNYRQMESCNELLDRREFSFAAWFLLCLVTCGLYHLYYQYKMGEAINQIQRFYELRVTKDLPILSLLAALIGFGVVADCIHQHEINNIDAELD